jgi:Flp pilus assembly protein TadD
MPQQRNSVPGTIISLVVLGAGVLLGGISSSGAQTTVTRDELLSGRVLGVTDDPSTSIESSAVLALSDEMREFLKEHVNPGATDKFRLQQLVDAIVESKIFKLEYDENTRTAAETFRLRGGNCLSFTTMFVALARGVGLNADFQEVNIPPDWSTRKDVFVLNLHVNVNVYMGSFGTRAVDFNIGDFKSTYDVELISDKRAVAHYFNNVGVERMQVGEFLDAFAFFRRAILETEGGFSPAWTNLGLLYRKGGHDDHAEAAYFEALDVDRGDVVAMSNLQRLYASRGDQEGVKRYGKKVDQHRMRNPHLRFALAREAFDEREYDTAIDHLKAAIRKEREEDEYYFLLALCYLMKGDVEKARRWTDKAVRVADTDEKKHRYSSEMDALLRGSRKP